MRPVLATPSHYHPDLSGCMARAGDMNRFSGFRSLGSQIPGPLRATHPPFPSTPRLIGAYGRTLPLSLSPRSIGVCSHGGGSTNRFSGFSDASSSLSAYFAYSAVTRSGSPCFAILYTFFVLFPSPTPAHHPDKPQYPQASDPLSPPSRPSAPPNREIALVLTPARNRDLFIEKRISI